MPTSDSHIKSLEQETALDGKATLIEKPRNKRILIAFVIFVTLSLGLFLPRTEVDFELEKLFPQDDPDLAFYQDQVELFGYDNDFLRLTFHPTSIYDSSFLTGLDLLINRLRAMDHVTFVFSPTEIPYLVKGPMGIYPATLLHSQDDLLPRDSIRISRHPFFQQVFKNPNVLSIYLKHAHFTDPTYSATFLRQVEEEIRFRNLGTSFMTGKLPAEQEFAMLIEKDFGLFLAVSFGMGWIVILLMLRSWKLSLLPITVSVVSMVWTFGIMSALGLKVSIMTSLLPPILMFTATSDTIHLLSAYQKTGNRSLAIRQVWRPTILTSLTTAIGFLSLLWVNVIPIKEFGLYASLGVVFAFIITYGTIPAMMKSSTPLSPNAREHFGKYSTSIMSKQKWVVVLTLLVAFGSVLAIRTLSVDAYLLKDLPQTSKVRQDFEKVDQLTGGTKPWQITIAATNPDQSIWDQEIMIEIEKISSYLKEKYPVNDLASPTDLLKYLHYTSKNKDSSAFSLPKDPTLYKRIASQAAGLFLAQSPFNEGNQQITLSGFIPEIGSKVTNNKNDLLQAYLKKNIDKDLINWRLTGTTYLIDKSHEQLSKALAYGLLTAILLVSVLLGIIYRSWKMVLIGMIPNLLPILITGALVALMDIQLQLTTAIIFTVSFGIAIDDTLHMIGAFHQTNGSPIRRLQHTLEHAGLAIIKTTLVILFGFLVFLFSSFGATFYMGLFVSITLVIALIVDLTLLPIMLYWMAKKEDH
ncbi:MAG: MMPL family transporter [Cyclobacteriaceae bacterium]|nr:MMPL family transporter [Cyclobacteriaceae bacterium HetDA_MAG_MS6]